MKVRAAMADATERWMANEDFLDGVEFGSIEAAGGRSTFALQGSVAACAGEFMEQEAPQKTERSTS